MTVTLRLPSFRVTARVIGAVLVGVLLATPAGTTGATYSFRAASCDKYDFKPIPGGTVEYSCNPNLPNKAIVTKVAFTLSDNSSAGTIDGCSLIRRPFVATAGVLNPFSDQKMASVPGTIAEFLGDPVRQSTSTI